MTASWNFNELKIDRKLKDKKIAKNILKNLNFSFQFVKKRKILEKK